MLKKQVGKRIQLLRRHKKLTQEQFSELIGIDSKNVSKIENENNSPSAETFNFIAKALNVDVFELFVFNDNIPYKEMKNEIIELLNDNKNILYIYRTLKSL